MDGPQRLTYLRSTFLIIKRKKWRVIHTTPVQKQVAFACSLGMILPQPSSFIRQLYILNGDTKKGLKKKGHSRVKVETHSTRILMQSKLKECKTISSVKSKSESLRSARLHRPARRLACFPLTYENIVREVNEVERLDVKYITPCRYFNGFPLKIRRFHDGDLQLQRARVADSFSLASFCSKIIGTSRRSYNVWQFITHNCRCEN